VYGVHCDTVEAYYAFKYANKTMFDDHLIANELPAKLRTEIVLHRYSSMISRVPFFTNLREDLIVDICQQINQFSVLPGDTIMQKGDPYRELIILAKGTARSIPSNEDKGDASPHRSMDFQNTALTGVAIAAMEVVMEFDRGSFFGELEFLGLSVARSTTVQAKTFCEVATIHPKAIHGYLPLRSVWTPSTIM
jgi:hypothetical protein